MLFGLWLLFFFELIIISVRTLQPLPLLLHTALLFIVAVCSFFSFFFLLDFCCYRVGSIGSQPSRGP
ncbi:hypothetical protein pipiens_009179, partial [Culex pipiens pipiens]